MRTGNHNDVRLQLGCVLTLILQILGSLLPGVATKTKPVIFNFGDSNSDTGGFAAGLGKALPLPFGRTFFHRSTGRVCDGRLIIDFLCESLHTNFLNPYLEALDSNFQNGANFASAGSTALLNGPVPFSLDVQVQQFLYFKSRSLDLIRQDQSHLGYKGVSSDKAFREALYMIDIGQNDISTGFSSNLTYDQVVVKSYKAVTVIKDAIQTLYNSGARNFWVHNTGPFGCLPENLALRRKNDSDLDEHGCLKTYNSASREFNSELSKLCDELSSKLKKATIVYTDIYAIKYDLFANYTKYGFEHPLTACCGNGGPPYNFNPNILCSMPGYNVCSDGSKYISWDGGHYTEAANAIVASKILTAQYSKPKLKFDFFLKNA